MADRNDRIDCLESLRGLAAVLVAVYHFDVGSFLHNGFTRNAWIMVDFFFVLSGFVIALNYQERITGTRDVVTFQAKRWLRLYPLHLLMLLVFVGLELAKYLAEHGFGLVANNRAFTANDGWAFAKHVLLLHNLVDPALTWNYPSWSISSEFYTYLVFAVLVLGLSGSRTGMACVSVVVAGAALAVLAVAGMGEENGLFRCLYAFFLGVVCFNVHRTADAVLASAWSYLLALGSLLVMAMIDGKDGTLPLLAPLVFAALIGSLVSSPESNLIRRALANRWLVYLGTISYGIYMIHAAIWWIATQVLKVVFRYPSEVGGDGTIRVVVADPLVSHGVLAAGMVLVIGLAHLSHRFVEMPCNRLRHRLPGGAGRG